VLRGTRDTLYPQSSFIYKAVTFYGGTFQSASIRFLFVSESPTTPDTQLNVLKRTLS
jgi:hypothetical protein